MGKSVIVVGGGISGIAASSLLVKSGFQVTLLEAADRVGGRVHTVKTGFKNQEIIERGAQWVHGENQIYELTKSISNELLEDDPFLDKMETNTDFVTISGIQAIAPPTLKKFLEFFRIIRDGPSDEEAGQSASVGEWFLKKIKSENFSGLENVAFIDWLEKLQLSIDGSDNWFESSIRGQMEYESCAGCPTILWIHGYQTLINIILNGDPNDHSIPEWIKLNSKVKQIDYGSKPIITTCEDGETYESDSIIVTVSLGVLKACHENLFKPTLSSEKVRAIQYLGFGTVNKIHVHFEDVFWDSDWLGLNALWYDEESTEFPKWTRSIFGFYTSKTSEKTLTGWLTGEDARFIETVDQQELSEVVEKLLKKFTGRKHLPKITSVTVTNWHSNPLTRGSYSFRSIESEKENVWAKDLASPISVPYDGLVCFAGEATHSSFYSTVHGAYETGIREATRIIQLYSTGAKV